MYNKLYKQASEIAELIRTGEYAKIKGRGKEQPRSSGFMSPRRQKEEAPEEETELEFIAGMIARIRSMNDEIELDMEQGESTPRPMSRSDLPSTEIGSKLKEDLMRDFGITAEQAAGVVGNLDHETGGFEFMQEIAPVVEGSRGGYGFAQWTGPRRVAFEEWASANEMDLNSYDANYGFLKHELTSTPEGDVLVNLSNAQTVEDAATIFSEEFLRPGKPNIDSRITRSYRYQ